MIVIKLYLNRLFAPPTRKSDIHADSIITFNSPIITPRPRLLFCPIGPFMVSGGGMEAYKAARLASYTLRMSEILLNFAPISLLAGAWPVSAAHSILTSFG